MSFQWALSIACRSLTVIALFGTAAYVGYLIERAGRRRGWNGKLWRYLTRRHAVRPPYSEADRRDWGAVVWPFVAFLLIAVVLWFTDPVGHH